MLTVNTIRYGTDNYVLRKQSLLTTSKPWDTTGKTNIEGFELSGIQPADSNRSVIFQVDTKYYKFDASQNLVEFTNTVNFDNVLAGGNTVDELSKVTAIPALVGKKIYPIIALDSAPDATVFPSIKIALKTRCNQDQYYKSEESAEYTLANASDKALPRIIDVTPSVIVTGKATATVQVSVKNNGEWSAYMSLTDAKDKQCSAVKYKATYNVTTLDGSDTAHVDSVTIRYTNGSAAVSGDTAEIYTVTQNYEVGLGYAQSVIKHKVLIDANLKAFVAFRNEPKNRKMVPLGTGTGSAQTLTLGVAGTDGKIVADSGINQNKLSVYVDGKPIYNYSYNTETSEVTLTVDNGVAISATYEYGWEPETWREMTKTTTQPYDAAGTYATYFEYTLPTGEEKKTVSNVKYVLYRPSGHITDAALGTATGSRQVFVLPHKAKAETIVCNGSWSYDDDTQILTVVAAQSTALTISYDYIAESQEVYGVTAGWAED